MLLSPHEHKQRRLLDTVIDLRALAACPGSSREIEASDSGPPPAHMGETLRFHGRHIRC
jgi:hypothetical protein